jgi:glucuronoarabinoxylan endo-1,4-beta-xylanase
MTIKTVADRSDIKQEIDGFGVCGAFRQADNLYGYPEEVRESVLDLLFSKEKGAGFSILRNIIGDSGSWGDRYDGPTKSIEPSEGVYCYEGDEDQIWLMNEAKKRGCARFVSSVWSPPAWMKTNACVDGGGELRPDKYKEFAEYIVRYVREYKARFDIDISAVSCANEPTTSTAYSSCLWTGAQMARFYADYLGPALEKENMGTCVFGPETEYFGNRILEEYASLFSNASPIPQIAAQHGYGGVIEPIESSFIKDRKLWLSEISDVSAKINDPSIHDGLVWAKTVHDYLTLANVNAFIYFWGMSMYCNKGISLIGLNLADKTVILNKRLFAIGNYSRFIRPGYKRIGVSTGPCDGVYLSAFMSDGGGNFVLAAVNTGEKKAELALECKGFSCSRLTPFRTSAGEDLKKLGTIDLSEDVLLPIEGKSVTTFTGACS